MKQETLERIAPLLEILRANAALEEDRPTYFHLNGRDFVHFHEYPEGVFADVRLSTGVVRLSVSTEGEQAELLDRVDDALASLDSHARERRGTRRRSRLQ